MKKIEKARKIHWMHATKENKITNWTTQYENKYETTKMDTRFPHSMSPSKGFAKLKKNKENLVLYIGLWNKR